MLAFAIIFQDFRQAGHKVFAHGQSSETPSVLRTGRLAKCEFMDCKDPGSPTGNSRFRDVKTYDRWREAHQINPGQDAYRILEVTVERKLLARPETSLPFDEKVFTYADVKAEFEAWNRVREERRNYIKKRPSPTKAQP